MRTQRNACFFEARRGARASASLKVGAVTDRNHEEPVAGPGGCHRNVAWLMLRRVAYSNSWSLGAVFEQEGLRPFGIAAMRSAGYTSHTGLERVANA